MTTNIGIDCWDIINNYKENIEAVELITKQIEKLKLEKNLFIKLMIKNEKEGYENVDLYIPIIKEIQFKIYQLFKDMDKLI